MKSVIFLILLSILGGFLAVFDWPVVTMNNSVLESPSMFHWLGTDALGQDVLLRLIAALPNTLLIAFLCGIIPLLIGFLLASISVFSGALVDRGLTKLIDVILLIPSLLPLMLLSVLLEPGMVTAIILISVLSWPDDFKVLRASIFKLIRGDAVLTASHFGAGKYYIFSRYIWPSLRPLLGMLFLHNARHAIMMSAGLAFLGLTDPRLLSWGTLLMEAQEQIHNVSFWWLLVGPLCAISAFVLLLNNLSENKRGSV